MATGGPRRTGRVALLVALAGVAAAGATAAEGPSLSQVVLFGIPSVSSLDAGSYPAAGRPCVERYLRLLPSRSPLRRAGLPGPAEAVAARRRNLVEQAVVLCGEARRAEARDFVAAVPVALEWEGMTDGPLGEAEAAERWAEGRAPSPLLPFVHLFAAHRLRAAFETLDPARDGERRALLARRYGDHLRAARAAPGGLVPCIADDLGRQDHVYLANRGRP